MDTIQSAAETYSSAYVFSMENVRSEFFKELRSEWDDSRFFLGKNRVMSLALGETPETAHRPALDELAADVHGDVGLLFTDRAPKAVAAFFAGYSTEDFARGGFVPAASVRVEAGRLESLPHTMLDQLRKLGMPVRLDKGTLVLPQAYSLCTAGKAITPEQGRLLKFFGHKLAVFRIELVSLVKDGVYKALLTPEALLKRSVYTKKEKRPSGRRDKKQAEGEEEGGEEGEGDEEMEGDEEEDEEEA